MTASASASLAMMARLALPVPWIRTRGATAWG
jgi:hypothetical protein